MSTYTALHLETDHLEVVQAACVRWLEALPGVRSVETQRGQFPLKRFARLLGEKPPTVLVLGPTPPGWITIHYNSFHKMEGLAAHLSGLAACRGVVVLAQTVSDAYYISVYEKGRPVRGLEFVEGQGWLAQEGTPLPFEAEPLGTDLAEPGEEPLYFFGAQETEEYCNQLGFSIFDQVSDPQWMILLAKRRGWWPFPQREQ